ncbi:peptidase M16 [Oscillatoriales cyanobacterium USR001]|nr:peptidase M16 [Oscillatoriales cyanobacterium USR001]
MSQPTTLKFPAHISQLDNGLTVIHQDIPATPVVVVDVWVKAGATLEPDPWSGMAHFLEHMIFKGTDRVGPGVFDLVIENHGGMANAATSHDYAHFFITTAAEYFEDVTDILGELLLRAAIPVSEFDLERDVVLEEIREAQDNPDWIGFQSLMELVYSKHPYRRSVLGTQMEVCQRSPTEMRSFHRCHYQPENMTVTIIGGVEQGRALEAANISFDGFFDRSYCPTLEILPEPPIFGVRRQELFLPRLEQARLMMAWIGPGVAQLQSAFGLDLLSVLLGDGRCSRLVRELREELQWVQGIGSSFSMQQDSSLFTISAVLKPQFVEQVEARICDRVWELLSTPISDAELARCKRQLCNDFAFSTETPGQLAGLYGYYNTIANAELAVTYPGKIKAFQALELQNLAQKYLSPTNYAVAILKPL